MLKGAGAKPGDTIKIYLEPDTDPNSRKPPMLVAFKKQLTKNGLLPVFNGLTASRQKEILKYLGFLKTEQSLLRNIEKLINQLKNKAEKK